MKNRIEHINLTVIDAKETASLLVSLFDWKIRWEGPAINDGYTVHVGGEDSYLALYTPKKIVETVNKDFQNLGGLNHIGIVVDDLDKQEERVKTAGFETFNHGDYEPGRRFYFRDGNSTEYEVVSYVS